MRRAADVPTRDAILDEMRSWLAREHGIALLGSLGFENAYALAMRRDRAGSLGIRSIADLAAHAPRAPHRRRLGVLRAAGVVGDTRRLWAFVRVRNRIRVDIHVRSCHRRRGRCDFGLHERWTDPANDLVVLEDPRGVILPYDAIVLLAAKRAADPMLRRALTPLVDSIPVALMREANYRVDRDVDKATPAAAAEWLDTRISACSDETRAAGHVLAAAWHGHLDVGAGLQGTLLGVRATLEGFPPVVIGAVMAAYYVGYVAGSLAAPSLIHRVGHIRVFAALSSVTCAAILLQSVFLQPAAWAVLRAASGACFAGIFVVAESWLNDRAKSGNRGALLGVYMVVLYLAWAPVNCCWVRGPAKRNTINSRGRSDIDRHGAARSHGSARTGFHGAATRARAGVAGEIAAWRNRRVRSRRVGGDIRGSRASLCSHRRARSAGHRGVHVDGDFRRDSSAAVPGRWSDRTDRRTVIMSVSVVAGLAAIATTAVEGGSLLFMTIAGLCTGLSLTLYPLAAAHVNDHLDSSQLVAASSTLILINGAGAVVGPLVVATAMQAAGARAYFASFALLHVALGVYAVWRKTRTSAVSPEHKEPFSVAAPQSSPTGRLASRE